MLFCNECQEKYKLQGSHPSQSLGNFIYDETCECCKKPFKTCWWNCGAEWIPYMINGGEDVKK